MYVNNVMSAERTCTKLGLTRLRGIVSGEDQTPPAQTAHMSAHVRRMSALVKTRAIEHTALQASSSNVFHVCTWCSNKLLVLAYRQDADIVHETSSTTIPPSPAGLPPPPSSPSGPTTTDAEFTPSTSAVPDDRPSPQAGFLAVCEQHPVIGEAHALVCVVCVFLRRAA